MTSVRTSESHPLDIAALELPGGGTVGITFCPGKQQPDAMTGAWARDLRADVERIRTWGTTAVVTLNTDEELAALGVPNLGRAVGAAGLAWYHLPIPDMASPDREWDERWNAVAPEIHRSLYAGARWVVHCKGGLGRAGTVAARLLLDRGVASAEAIALVRRVRPGAIESRAQEHYLARVPVGRYASAAIAGRVRGAGG